MSSLSSSASSSLRPSSSMERRRGATDYTFGKLIGEGAYSSVFLARDVAGKEVAIKVCEKDHIIKYKKQEYIHSEKKILAKITDEWNPKVPFFVRLHATFQDSKRLYFVMSLAKNGDLLKFIEKMTEQNVDCTQFYSGELVAAVEFLHSKGIIHRDLKPENILLDEHMHILITDFGSAKLLDQPDPTVEIENGESNHQQQPKRSSFVGTAQYVSPEILTNRGSTRASDLWAIGCIIYQMITGMPPFQSQSEYLIFQKIQKLEYHFHEGFQEEAKDLIRKLLVIEPSERIGATDSVYYTSIREHPFFNGLNFDTMHESTPPQLLPFVPEAGEDRFWNRHPDLKPGPEGIATAMLADDDDGDDTDGVLDHQRRMEMHQSPGSGQPTKRNIEDMTDEERKSMLDDQLTNNKYHRFVEGNLIIKQGILDKKKGLWPRRRVFLLTEGPHLYYVDPDNMVLKGEIPWDANIRPEVRDFKIFFVHTKNRIYYLIDPESKAKEWCYAIEKVREFYFGKRNTSA